MNTRRAFEARLTPTSLALSLAVAIMAAVLLAGCGDRSQAKSKASRTKSESVTRVDRPATALTPKTSREPNTAAPAVAAVPVQQTAQQNPASRQAELETPPQFTQAPVQQPKRRSLADLAEQAAAEEFRLPTIEEGKVAAAGIRKLEGRHITIYTDVPQSDDVAELTTIFDKAVPLYCEYFGFDPAKVADWKVVGYLVQDKERFQGAGLFPDNLPPFPNGYTRGSEFWWYEQPSAYYRRHLMLHEGVHAFMFRWLGGAGPPWYTEGMAELLGTHQWQDGKLQLGYMPLTKEEVPYWGRVKIVKDQFAAGNGLQLTDVFKLDAQSHLRNEAYGWCWAASQFLQAHPLTHDAFLELKNDTKVRSIDFSVRLVNRLKPHWPQIAEDWQLFVANCDYGYDVARASVVRKDAESLPAGGGTATIAADRGWQSSGFQVEAGNTYQIEAAGKFTIGGDEEKPWPCEPNGITLHYHRGQPLGMLLAGISEVGDEVRGITPLAKPTPIGADGTITPAYSGVLYFCLNESPAGLADNQGTVAVRVKEAK